MTPNNHLQSIRDSFRVFANRAFDLARARQDLMKLSARLAAAHAPKADGYRTFEAAVGWHPRHCAEAVKFLGALSTPPDRDGFVRLPLRRNFEIHRLVVDEHHHA